MKFKKFRSSKEVNINISPYIIKDWTFKNQKISGPEKKVLNFLLPWWKHHVVLREFRIPSQLWRIDILNLTSKIAIEVSPSSTHGKYNKFMHGSKVGYLAVIRRDLDKEEWIIDNGFKYISLIDDDLENLSKEWFLEKYDITL